MENSPENHIFPELMNSESISNSESYHPQQVYGNIDEHMHSSRKEQIEPDSKARERKRMNLVLFILNICFPIGVAILHASFLLDFTNGELKGTIAICIVILGFIITVISSAQIAPWLQVLKLFLHFDSILPAFIASSISFYSAISFLSTGLWYEECYLVLFPLWIIYFGGYLRVIIAYGRMARWEIITYKIAVLLVALIFFYIGFDYMNGGYKITQGYLIEIQNTVKQMLYLYIFAIVELYFQFFRKLSYFDQTEELKFVYEFKAQSEKERHFSKQIKLIKNYQPNNLQQLKEEYHCTKAMQEEIGQKNVQNNSKAASNRKKFLQSP